MTIENKEVIFDNYKAKVYVSSSTKVPSIEYKLKNSNSKIEINEISNLQTGENILNAKVIVENGIEQIYEIIIYKYSKTEEILYSISTIVIIGGIGYGIYLLIKKQKIFIK